MMTPAFTNVIVTYNNRSDIAGLLTDVSAHAPDSPTIVVDNASPDGTADEVAARFPRVRLVRNSRNVGYARAVNQLFRLSTSPYVFLLNPDIRIPGPDVSTALQECLDNDDRVAVAGPLQFKDGAGRPHLNFTWSYWTMEALKVFIAHRRGKKPSVSGPLRVSFLNAGCLFIRRTAFEAVGSLNEKYFLYGEEPDLFFKLMRHGFECRLLPGVSVYHAREQSLQSIPSLRRLRFRIQGAVNIADAVSRGVTNIVVDRLAGRKPG